MTPRSSRSGLPSIGAFVALVLAALLLFPMAAVAQSSAPAASAAPAASPAGSMAPASPAVPPAGSPVPVPTLSPECQAASLPVLNSGRLTMATDNPAYPPWWGGKAPDGSDWALGYPPSKEGYEAAVAYGVAETLGFTDDQVDWIVVPFLKSFAPGKKNFDMYLAQVSIKPKRAKAVDFSDPYYTFNQAVIALAGKPITQVSTVEGLKDFQLGAMTGTTSLDTINDVVKPTKEAKVYDDNDKALRALKNNAIDGLVVDLPTAFYMRDGQLGAKTPSTIVGQFPVSGTPERLGIVLAKGSKLTPCVDEALAIMTANGTLQSIYDKWLGAVSATPIPFFAMPGASPSAAPGASAAPVMSPAAPAPSGSTAP
jgi:polar amino acid transport system substrate-binding protein